MTGEEPSPLPTKAKGITNAIRAALPADSKKQILKKKPSGAKVKKASKKAEKQYKVTRALHLQ